MIIKISDGSEVEVEVGMLLRRLPAFKSSPEEGSLEVIGFDTGLPVVLFGEEKSAISGDTIESVVSKEEPLVKVDLGGGNVVLVPAKAAEIIGDMLVLQAALLEQIKDLQSGGTVADLLAQLEILKAVLKGIAEAAEGALK